MLWQLSGEPQRLMPCGKPSLPSGALAYRAIDEHLNQGGWRK